jgi:VCBS repeat-containing protein
MRIPVDAEVLTAAGSSVQLQADGQQALMVGENQNVALGQDVFVSVESNEASAAKPSNDATEALIGAIKQGQGTLAELELDPTAAALAGGGGGGSTFVRLKSILESTVPLALAYPRTAKEVEEVPRWSGAGSREPDEPGEPSIKVPDGNDGQSPTGPVAVPGHISIAEDATSPVTGTFTVTTPGGLQSLWVGGTPISLTELQNLGTKPVTIVTSKGVLTITAYDPLTGEVRYEYLVDGPQDHSAGDESVLDHVNLVVVDEQGRESSGQLSVLIIDTAPEAKADTNEIVEDTASVQGNVITGGAGGAGADIKGADAVSVSGVQSGTVTGHVADGHVDTKVQGQYGTITIHADGSYSYELDNSLAAVQALNDGDKLSDVFSYTLTDADGDKSTTTVTITIKGVTDGAPVITPEDSDGNVTGAHNSVVEGTGDTVTGSVTVKAEAGIQTVTVGGKDVTAASVANPVEITTDKGILKVTGYDVATGKITYTYTETGGADDHSAGDDSVRDVFVVSVTDKAGQTTNGNLNIQIIDTAPEAKADTNEIVEDTASVQGNVITGGAGGAGADIKGADAVSVSGVQSGTASGDVADGHVGTKVQGQYGTITIKADGTYIYELDNSKRAVQALNDGEKLVDTFSYTLKDADGDKSTTTVTITINGKTDAPVILASTEDGGPVNGQFSYTGLDASTPYVVSQQAGHGSVTIDASGKWVYTPHADYNGQDSFVVAIKDVSGKTTTETITINLAPEKDAFDDSSDAVGTKPVVIDVLANDAFEGSGKTVTHINGQSITAGGSAVTVDNGKVTLGVDGKLSFVANAGYEGTAHFTYTAKTAQGTPETANVNVAVNPGLYAREDKVEISEGVITAKADVVLTVDLSGSMNAWVEHNGEYITRLDMVRLSLQNLFNSGSVNSVRIYTFETDAVFHSSTENGGWFTDLDQAMNVVNSWTADGATLYSLGIENIMNTYQAPPPGGGNLVSIFLTDGDPNEDWGVNSELEAQWIEFLKENNFDGSYAIGMGAGLVSEATDNLEPIAWTPGEAVGDIVVGGHDQKAVLISDSATQLTDELLKTLRVGVSATGNATANDSSGFAGWDSSGWKIASLEYLDSAGSSKTFTFTGAQSSTSIDVYTSAGLLIGKLTLSGDGSYLFKGLDGFNTEHDVSAVLHYTARDANGDTYQTDLTLTVKDGVHAAFSAMNVAEHQQALDVMGVEAQPLVSRDNHSAETVPVTTVHEVWGTPGDDLLIGTHEDDLFIWSHGDEGSVAAPANDVVQDFGMGHDILTGSDKLVLDDLLQGEESVTDLSAYLHLEKSSDGKDTLIKVSTEGKLTADGSNFNQTITVKGVDLVGDAHTGTAAEQNALIKQLISQGKLTMDGQH